jgi:hypothetical protein
MCGSIIDSVASGTIICGTGAFFILSGKAEYIWLGSLIIIIGTMQFVDALIWLLKAQHISTQFISKYGIILVLMLELIISYLGYVFYYKKRVPIFEIALSIYIIMMGYIWISMCEDTTITSDGYLKWCGVNIAPILKVSFIVFLMIPVLFFPVLEQKLLFLSLIGAIWVYNYNHEAFGSRWCYSTVIYAVLALGLFLYKSS